MSRRSFSVVAKWDAEAAVFYSESDILGLHIEAATLEEFEEIMRREAPDLIVANHISKQELSRGKIRDLIPAIFLSAIGPQLVVA
jgi:hypothetical protein